jgi:hypothetical protein
MSSGRTALAVRVIPSPEPGKNELDIKLSAFSAGHHHYFAGASERKRRPLIHE